MCSRTSRTVIAAMATKTMPKRAACVEVLVFTPALYDGDDFSFVAKDNSSDAENARPMVERSFTREVPRHFQVVSRLRPWCRQDVQHVERSYPPRQPRRRRGDRGRRKPRP